MRKKTIMSPIVAPTPSFFSQGVRVGDTIYVSGQVAYNGDGKLVGKGDIATQMQQVIANIKAVLESGGATLDDVVKVTMYITNMELAPAARAVRMEHFRKNPPASTGVEVSRLADPDLLVEMDAVAILTDRAFA